VISPDQVLLTNHLAETKETDNMTLQQIPQKLALMAGIIALLAQPALAIGPVYPAADNLAASAVQQARAKTIRLGMQAFDDGTGKWDSTNFDAYSGFLTFEGLVRIGTDGLAAPGGAESWSSDASLKEWVFNIRKGATYSDGSLLNAKRYEYTLLDYLNPANENWNTAELNAITGAAEWSDAFAALGEEKDAAKQGTLKKALADAEKTMRASIRAVDANDKPCTGYAQKECLKLRITLNAPVAYLPHLLTSNKSWPVKEDRKKIKQWWRSAANWVGNGPYVMRRSDGKNLRELAPNARYWRGTPKTNLTLSGDESYDVLFAGYTAGKYDVLSLVNGPALPDALKSAHGADLRSINGTCVSNVVMRSTQKPFDEINVRRAFAAALDRERLSKEVTDGELIPALTFIPEGVSGALPGEKRNGLDLAAARKLLAASSYKTADALPAIVFPYIDDNEMLKKYATYLSERYKEAFPGLKVELKAVKGDDWEDTRTNPKSGAGIFWAMWCGSRPEDFIGAYFRSGQRGTAFSGWSNKTFDEIADKMAVEPDAAKRAALATQAHSILIDESPYVFTGAFSTRSLVKPNVTIGTPTPFDGTFVGDMDYLAWDIK
jgi:oligopeptide transport system substrate-binding protein